MPYCVRNELENNDWVISHAAVQGKISWIIINNTNVIRTTKNQPLRCIILLRFLPQFLKLSFFSERSEKKTNVPSFSAHLLAISTLSRSGRKHVNTSSNTGRHIYQWHWRSQTRKRGYKLSSLFILFLFIYLEALIKQYITNREQKNEKRCVW